MPSGFNRDILTAEVVDMTLFHQHDRIILAEDSGETLAEVTFPERNGLSVIEHTIVSPTLRGQGIADQLLLATAQQLREEGRMARVTCPYAIKWFSAHPEWQSLLA
ncbi:MAG: GNAT family N-acetyltransferase [Oscillospiraceae bacterium]